MLHDWLDFDGQHNPNSIRSNGKGRFVWHIPVLTCLNQMSEMMIFLYVLYADRGSSLWCILLSNRGTFMAESNFQPIKVCSDCKELHLW